MPAEDDGFEKGWRGGKYVRRARLAPVALVVTPLLPVAGTAVATLPGWLKLTASAWFLAAYLVQELGRDRGLRLQDSLWASWGGPPTTDALRWRTSKNPVMTAARHRDLVGAIGGKEALPSSADELRNPTLADQKYEAAIAQLRVLSRTSEPLLEAENAGYGFRRNCLGLRGWGIGAALISLLGTVAFAVWHSPDFQELIGVSVAINVLALLFWVLIVKPAWVHRQAISYSDALFAAASRRANSAKIEPSSDISTSPEVEE